MKSISYQLIFLILIMSSDGNDVVLAQDNNIEISTMKVSLWSEYDNSKVLVLYRGSVSPNLKLPATIKFNIVRGIEPHVASVTPANSHIHDPFEIKSEDGDTYLTFLLKERDFHIEFYYTAFPPGVPNKSFSYKYKSYYPIKFFSYEVQQPVGATNFITLPASIRTFSDSKGILNHLVLAGSVAAGETKTVNVSYLKSNTKTSLQLLENPEGKWSVYGIISTSVLVILVGLLIWSYSKNRRRRGGKIQREGAKRAAKKGRKRNQESKLPKKKLEYRSDRIPRFCSNCGEKLEVGSNYCGSCGYSLHE